MQWREIELCAPPAAGGHKNGHVINPQIRDVSPHGGQSLLQGSRMRSLKQETRHELAVSVKFMTDLGLSYGRGVSLFKAGFRNGECATKRTGFAGFVREVAFRMRTCLQHFRVFSPAPENRCVRLVPDDRPRAGAFDAGRISRIQSNLWRTSTTRLPGAAPFFHTVKQGAPDQSP